MIIVVQAVAGLVMLGALAAGRRRPAIVAWLLFAGLAVYQLVTAFV